MSGNTFSEFASVQAVREYDRANPIGLPPLEQVTPPAPAAAPPSLTPAQPATDTRQPAATQGPPPAMVPLFEAAAARHGVPINVIMALAEQESRYNPRAVGTPTQWGRARGIMQYLDSTAQGLGINPYDPAQAIDGAALQIRQRLDRGASMEDAIREHFAGPNRALWGPRTQRYGEEVVGRAARLADMLGDRYAPPAPAAPETVAPQDAGAAGGGGSMLGDVGRMSGAALTDAGAGAMRAANIGLQLLREYTPSRVVSDWLVGRSAGDERVTAAVTGMADRVQAFAEQVRQGASPEMQRDIATTMPGGDLFSPSTWTMGSAPTVRGYIGIGAGLFGSMLPVIVAGVVGGPGAAAVVGGATGGGGGAQTARDLIKELAGRQVEVGGRQVSALEAESPYYRQLRGQGLSHEQAVARTSEAAERFAFLLTTPVSAAGGAATGALLSPATRVAAGAPLAGRIAARAGLGAVEEGAQEATETVAARTGTNIGAGTSLNVTEGTFGDAVLGAMAGGSVGAAGGAMSRREEPAPRPGLTIGRPPRTGPAAIEGPEPGPGPDPDTLALPWPDGPRPASATPDVIPMGDGNAPPTEPAPAGPLTRAMAQQTATSINTGTEVLIEVEGLDPIPGTVDYETPEGVMVRTEEGALLVSAEDIRTGAARVTPVPPAAPAAPVAPGVPAAEGPEPAVGPVAGAAAPQSAPQMATPPLPSAPPASDAATEAGAPAVPEQPQPQATAPARPLTPADAWPLVQAGTTERDGATVDALIGAKAARDAGGINDQRQLGAFLADWQRSVQAAGLDPRTEAGNAAAMAVIRRHAISLPEFVARSRAEQARHADAADIDIDTATEGQLRGRLRHLARQANAAGGAPGKALVGERRRVEAAINRLTAAKQKAARGGGLPDSRTGSVAGEQAAALKPGLPHTSGTVAQRWNSMPVDQRRAWVERAGLPPIRARGSWESMTDASRGMLIAAETTPADVTPSAGNVAEAAPKPRPKLVPAEETGHATRVRKTLGDVLDGEVIQASEAVGYMSAGTPMRVTRIEKNGIVFVENVATGAGTTLSRGEMEGARQRGVTFSRVAAPEPAPAIADKARDAAREPAATAAGAPKWEGKNLAIFNAEWVRAQRIDRDATRRDLPSGHRLIELRRPSGAVEQTIWFPDGNFMRRGIEGSGKPFREFSFDAQDPRREMGPALDRMMEEALGVLRANPAAESQPAVPRGRGATAGAEDADSRSSAPAVADKPPAMTDKPGSIADEPRALADNGPPANTSTASKSDAAEMLLDKSNDEPAAAPSQASDDGDAPSFSRYSLSADGREGGMSRDEIERGIRDFEARLGRTLSEMGVVRDISPTEAAAFGPTFTGRAKAAFYPKSKRLVLISASLSGPRDLEATLRHELLAHYGINLFRPEQKRALLDRLTETRGNPLFRSAWRHVDSLYGDASEDVKAEELLAHTAEKSRDRLTEAFDRLVKLVADFLRKNGWLAKRIYAPSEVRELVRAIADGIRRGDPQRTSPDDNAGRQQRSTDIGNVSLSVPEPGRTPIRIGSAIIGHDLGVGRNHPDYEAAKAGDREAALRLARDLVDSQLVERARKTIGRGRPLIAPVTSIEANGRNKIPLMVAAVLAEKLGLQSAADITQANAPKRTSLGGLDRLFSAPMFDGPVEPGREYLLVDDTLTQGATFAAMASHIEAGGGRVIGAVALTGKDYSATLGLSPATLQELRGKYGDVETDFRAATGYGFDALTESEARYLTRFRQAAAVRDRITSEGSAGRSRLGEGEAGPGAVATSTPEGRGQAAPVPEATVGNATLSVPDAAPVATLTGDEVQGEDIAARRRAAREWVNENLRGRSFYSAALKADVVVNRRGTEKTVSGAVGDRILDGVPAIQALLERGAIHSREDASVEDRQTGIKSFVRLAGAVTVAGEVREYLVTVREHVNGGFYYRLGEAVERRSAGGGSDPAWRAGAMSSGGSDPEVSLPPGQQGKAGGGSEAQGATLNLVEVPRAIKAPEGWGQAETQNDDAPLTPEALAALGDILRVIAGPEAVLEAGRTGSAEGIAAGPLVRLSMSLGEDRANWVTGHEAIHTLRNLGRITDKEWAILSDAAAREGWGERFGTDRRYRNRTAEVRTEEAVAEAFAAWATGNLDGRGPVARVFQRMKAFLQRLRNALAGRGFQSRESVFQAIRRGEMGRRAPGSAAPTRTGTATTAEISADLDARVDAGVFTQDAAGLIHLSLPPEKQAKQDSKAKEFVRGVIERAEPWVMATLPLRPLLEEVASYLPSAQKFLRTKQAMDAMRAEWFAKSAKLSNKWLKYRSSNKAENAALMDLMHESTLAGIDPSKPPADDSDADARAQYDALRARYDAMPAAGKALYAEVRDTYSELADAFDAALMDNVSAAVMVAAQDAERAHRKETARIEASEAMSPEEKQEAQAKADKTLKRVQTVTKMNRGARMQKLRQQFESNRVAGPYFPLARFGEFFVTARDKAGKVVSYSLFEWPTEQRAFARQMEAEGYTVTMDRVSNEKGSMRSQVDPRFVAEVEGLLAGANVPADLQDAIWQRFLQRMPDMSIRTSRIHRKGTAGFTKDAIRAFGHHMFHGSHQLARLTYAMQLQEDLANAREEAESSGKPNTAVAVVNEMAKRLDFIMNPTGAAWSHALTSAGFVYYLSASPAAALLNLTQTAMVGVPVLAASRGGSVGRASLELSRALKDVGSGFKAGEWRSGFVTAARSKSLTADEQALIREIYEIGLADQTQAHDLAGVAESGVAYSNTRHKVMSVISYGFHHAERVNREATALAAYRMQRKAGLDHAAAVEEANRLTWKIHFDYSNTARPRVMQGDTAKVVLLFRNFTVNMLFRLFRDTHQMVRGETAEVRREARTQLVGMTMMMMTLGGISGVWGYGLAMGLASLFFGAPGQDEEDELRKWMQRNLGVTATGILMDGLPGYGLGISLSERVGMPDLWLRSSDRMLESKAAFHELWGQLLGPVFYGIPANVWRGADMVVKGLQETGEWREVFRGVETAVPKSVRDLMRAGRFATEGALTQRGEPLMASVPSTDVLKQALGFTPARLAELYGQNTSLQNAQKEVADERTKIMNRYYRAMRADDQDKMRQAQGSILRFNDQHPEAAITPRSLMQSMRTRARNSAQTVDGVRLPPRMDGPLRERLPARTYN